MSRAGDYDQDMAGLLSYSLNTNVNPNTITVTTSVFADSTPNQMGFGYIIAGTTQDGFHTHSSINFSPPTDPTGVLPAPMRRSPARPASRQPRLPTPWARVPAACCRTAVLCRQVGWVQGGGRCQQAAASTAAPNDIPDQAYEWDTDGNGQPDNYFFARNPGQLVSNWQRCLRRSRPCHHRRPSSPTRSGLQTTTRIYQARFDSNDWSGKLLSFPVDITTGTLQSAEWDAGSVIAGQNYDSGREWITWDGTQGLRFVGMTTVRRRTSRTTLPR